MSVQITDDGKTIKVVDSGKTTYISKEDLDISANGDYVSIGSYSVLYTDVTVPSSGSAAILAATIKGYTDSEVSVANTPSLASSTTAAAANASRKSITIQNQGTNVLYVRYGASASTSVFHIALKACTANDDGNGGAVYNNEYDGVVSIAGTSPRYTVLEN